MTLRERLRQMMAPKFVAFAVPHYAQKWSVVSNLRKLSRYHDGELFDFSTKCAELLRRIAVYADDHCPYYRRVFADARVRPRALPAGIERIPLLDKSIIRAHEGELVSDEIGKLIHGRRNTGGSTGEPLEFATSPNWDSEHQRFIYERLGFVAGDRILAMDGTAVSPELVKEGVFWTPKSRYDLPYGSMALSSLYLTDATAARYVEFLRSFRPAFIRGYPAFVNEIATHILRTNTKLPRQPKGIVLTSESVTAPQIKNVAEAFGAKVVLQYGHAEAAVFGYTVDDSHQYYCSPLYGLVEVLDESGRHVAPGGIGQVVVTGFSNYAMPFIRYKTGDLAVFGGDEDGIVRLTSVVGRTQDYVYAANGDKTLLTALVFGLHYKAFANIRKWQIVQDVAGEVTIRIVRAPSFTRRDEEEIRSNFEGIARVSTHFAFVESIPLTKRGKHLFVVQNVGRDIRNES